MNKAECFSLGYIAKLHGFKGEVSLFLDTTHPEEYENIDACFIELDGILTPFFVAHLSVSKKGFLKIKFEDVENEMEARKLLKKTVYLPLTILPKLKGNRFYDFEVLGFKVVDSEFGEVGELIHIIDEAVNPLLQILNKDKEKEVLLPLANDLIQKVDRANKTLFVKSTPGLIQMYLEG